MKKVIGMAILVALALVMIATGCATSPAPTAPTTPATPSAKPTATATPSPTASPKPTATATPSTPATTPTAKPAGAPVPDPKVKMPSFLVVMGGASPGTGSDIRARALRQRLTQDFPQMATRQFPAGGNDAIYKINSGEAQIGTASTWVIVDGVAGVGTFVGKPPQTNVRAFSVHSSTSVSACFALKDSPFTTVKELGKARIGVGPQTSATAQIVESMLKMYGISYASIQSNGGLVSFANIGDAFSLLGAGKLDAVFWASGHPFVSAKELDLVRGIKLLDFGPEARAEAIRIKAGYEVTIPKGTYSAQTVDYKGVASSISFMVSKDMPDDAVFNLLASTFKDDGRFFGDFDPEYKQVEFIALNGTTNPGAPWHPGAAAYWTARGIKPWAAPK